MTLPRIYRGRDRSFFFVTFEKTHQEEQTSTAFRTLPTREFQNGDFSRLFDPGYTGNASSGTVVGTDVLGRPVRFGRAPAAETVDVIRISGPAGGRVAARAVVPQVSRGAVRAGVGAAAGPGGRAAARWRTGLHWVADGGRPRRSRRAGSCPVRRRR